MQKCGHFPALFSLLKSVLGFNQHQITKLGVACDIGENLGLIPCLLCNKFPPWVILSLGAFACLLGYGAIWLALTRTLPSLPDWVLWVALCLATNSCTWFSTAVLVTNMRNFPLSRGTVAGILKGYAGLSAAVYTEIYSALLQHSSSLLLLFLAVGIPTLCFVLMYYVRPCTPASGDDASESSHLLFIQAASVVLAVYLLTATILNNVVPLIGPVSYVFVVIMVVLLLTPLAIPIKMTMYRSYCSRSSWPEQEAQVEWHSKKHPLLVPSSSVTGSGSSDENDSILEGDMLRAEAAGATRKRSLEESRILRSALVKADFWLLFLVYFVGVGSGVTVLNNLAQIGIAQGIENTTLLLCLFSFFNFVGRLGGGILSEIFVRSRTIWITCTQVVMSIAYLLFASAIDGTLYIATTLLGICYGVQFSIIVPTASELFGLKHFGMIINFMALGNLLGASLFSGLLAGFLYDNEAGKQQQISCLGPNCFRITFPVLAGGSGVGVLLSVLLTRRIKPVYQMLYSGGSFQMPQNSTR